MAAAGGAEAVQGGSPASAARKRGARGARHRWPSGERCAPRGRVRAARSLLRARGLARGPGWAIRAPVVFKARDRPGPGRASVRREAREPRARGSPGSRAGGRGPRSHGGPGRRPRDPERHRRDCSCRVREGAGLRLRARRRDRAGVSGRDTLHGQSGRGAGTGPGHAGRSERQLAGGEGRGRKGAVRGGALAVFFSFPFRFPSWLLAGGWVVERWRKAKNEAKGREFILQVWRRVGYPEEPRLGWFIWPESSAKRIMPPRQADVVHFTCFLAIGYTVISARTVCAFD